MLATIDRQCVSCLELKPLHEFSSFKNHLGATYHRKRCKACYRAYMAELNIRCKQCGKSKRKCNFIENSHTYQLCGVCRSQNQKWWEENVRHVQYDYSFARTINRWSHERTLEWLSKGYNKDKAMLARCIPDEPMPDWQPDPVEQAA